MADILTTLTLQDGQRNAVAQMYLEFVDTGDATTQFLDVSGLSADTGDGAACSQVVVQRVTSSLNGFSATLLWDATTDVPFLHLPEGNHEQDFRRFGGLHNTEATGFTGDIMILTAGFAEADDIGTVQIEVTKKYD